MVQTFKLSFFLNWFNSFFVAWSNEFLPSVVLGGEFIITENNGKWLAAEPIHLLLVE
jgi:hypothetical protein